MTDPANQPAAAGGTACKTCSAPLAEGAPFCARCGSPQPNAPVCPHCGAQADASPHASMRFACNVCGGPRVPSDGGRAPSDAESVALRRAEAARRAMNGARGLVIGAGVLLGFQLIVLALVVALMGFGWPAALAFTLDLPILVIFVLARRRANAARSRIAPALDEAWTTAVAELAKTSTTPVDSRLLAKSFRLSPQEADQMLALAAANDELRADVSGEGDLALSTRQVPMLRVADVGTLAPARGAEPPQQAESGDAEWAESAGRVDPAAVATPRKPDAE